MVPPNAAQSQDASDKNTTSTTIRNVINHVRAVEDVSDTVQATSNLPPFPRTTAESRSDRTEATTNHSLTAAIGDLDVQQATITTLSDAATDVISNCKKNDTSIIAHATITTLSEAPTEVMSNRSSSMVATSRRDDEASELLSGNLPTNLSSCKELEDVSENLTADMVATTSEDIKAKLSSHRKSSRCANEDDIVTCQPPTDSLTEKTSKSDCIPIDSTSTATLSRALTERITNCTKEYNAATNESVSSNPQQLNGQCLSHTIPHTSVNALCEQQTILTRTLNDMDRAMENATRTSDSDTGTLTVNSSADPLHPLTSDKTTTVSNTNNRPKLSQNVNEQHCKEIKEEAELDQLRLQLVNRLILTGRSSSGFQQHDNDQQLMTARFQHDRKQQNPEQEQRSKSQDDDRSKTTASIHLNPKPLQPEEVQHDLPQLHDNCDQQKKEGTSVTPNFIDTDDNTQPSNGSTDTSLDPVVPMTNLARTHNGNDGGRGSYTIPGAYRSSPHNQQVRLTSTSEDRTTISTSSSAVTTRRRNSSRRTRNEQSLLHQQQAVVQRELDRQRRRQQQHQAEPQTLHQDLDDESNHDETDSTGQSEICYDGCTSSTAASSSSSSSSHNSSHENADNRTPSMSQEHPSYERHMDRYRLISSDGTYNSNSVVDDDSSFLSEMMTVSAVLATGSNHTRSSVHFIDNNEFLTTVSGIDANGGSRLSSTIQHSSSSISEPSPREETMDVEYEQTLVMNGRHDYCTLPENSTDIVLIHATPINVRRRRLVLCCVSLIAFLSTTLVVVVIVLLVIDQNKLPFISSTPPPQKSNFSSDSLNKSPTTTTTTILSPSNTPTYKPSTRVPSLSPTQVTARVAHHAVVWGYTGRRLSPNSALLEHNVEINIEGGVQVTPNSSLYCLENENILPYQGLDIACGDGGMIEIEELTGSVCELNYDYVNSTTTMATGARCYLLTNMTSFTNSSNSSSDTSFNHSVPHQYYLNGHVHFSCTGVSQQTRYAEAFIAEIPIETSFSSCRNAVRRLQEQSGRNHENSTSSNGILLPNSTQNETLNTDNKIDLSKNDRKFDDSTNDTVADNIDNNLKNSSSISNAELTSDEVPVSSPSPTQGSFITTVGMPNPSPIENVGSAPSIIYNPIDAPIVSPSHSSSETDAIVTSMPSSKMSALPFNAPITSSSADAPTIIEVGSFLSLGRFCRADIDHVNNETEKRGWIFWSDIYFCNEGERVIVQPTGALYNGRFPDFQDLKDSFQAQETDTKVVEENREDYVNRLTKLRSLRASSSSSSDHKKLKKTGNIENIKQRHLQSLFDIDWESILEGRHLQRYCYSTAYCTNECASSQNSENTTFCDTICRMKVPSLLISNDDPRARCDSRLNNGPSLQLRRTVLNERVSVVESVVSIVSEKASYRPT